MSGSKISFSGDNSTKPARRGTDDTESDFMSMRFENTRQLENFTMNNYASRDDGPLSVPMNRKSSTNALFKVILLGDSLVGKSAIVMRLVVRFIKIIFYRTNNSP